MKKVLSILLATILISLGFFLYGKINNKIEVKEKAIKSELEEKREVPLDIIVTDKITYNMTREIVKDKHRIEYMFKDKNSLMNFAFTEDSLENIKNKDLFIYMGASYEPWVSSFVDKLEKNKVGIVNLSRGIRIYNNTREIKVNNYTLRENPNYLLSSENYKIALVNIKNAIQDKDPKNRDFYEKNFNESIKNIDQYTKELRETIAKLNNVIFLCDEDEEEYFLKQMDLRVIKLNKNMIGLPPPFLVEETEKAVNEAKVTNYKSLVFLYTRDDLLQNYDGFIKKYNLTAIKLQVPNYNVKYEEVVKQNRDNFKKYLDNLTTEKKN